MKILLGYFVIYIWLKKKLVNRHTKTAAPFKSVPTDADVDEALGTDDVDVSIICTFSTGTPKTWEQI